MDYHETIQTLKNDAMLFQKGASLDSFVPIPENENMDQDCAHLSEVYYYIKKRCDQDLEQFSISHYK